MSVHVLLNLCNKFGKTDKMRGLPSILSLFRNEFIKINTTGARMLDSIYHMLLQLFTNRIWCEIAKILPSFTQRYYGRHYATLIKSVNHYSGQT